MTESSPPPPDTAQFVRLLKKHERRLSAYVHALVPDWSTGEDIIQETSVRMWEQFADYREGEDFGAWACTIARYMVLAARKTSSRQKLFFDDELLKLVEDQLEEVNREQDARLSALSECMQRLSEPHRVLLECCYGSATNIKEMAARLSRSPQSTYMTLSRVRRALHDCIEKRLLREAS